jgi:hypothetical protein
MLEHLLIRTGEDDEAGHKNQYVTALGDTYKSESNGLLIM